MDSCIFAWCILAGKADPRKQENYGGGPRPGRGTPPWLPADLHGADPGVGVGRADPGGPNRGSESRRSDSLRI